MFDQYLLQTLYLLCGRGINGSHIDSMVSQTLSLRPGNTIDSTGFGAQASNKKAIVTNSSEKYLDPSMDS